MRTSLQGLDGKRVSMTAVFWKYGTFRGRGCVARTILLKNIRDEQGNILADHVWINYTAGFDSVGVFRPGDVVKFTAQVSSYIKGYCGENIEGRLMNPIKWDYRLKYPRNVQKIGTMMQDARKIGTKSFCQGTLPYC